MKIHLFVLAYIWLFWTNTIYIYFCLFVCLITYNTRTQCLQVKKIWREKCFLSFYTRGSLLSLTTTVRVWVKRPILYFRNRMMRNLQTRKRKKNYAKKRQKKNTNKYLHYECHCRCCAGIVPPLQLPLPLSLVYYLNFKCASSFLYMFIHVSSLSNKTWL